MIRARWQYRAGAPWGVPGEMPELSATDKAEILRVFPPSETPLDNETLVKLARAAEKAPTTLAKHAVLTYRCCAAKGLHDMHGCFLGGVVKIQGHWLWVQRRYHETQIRLEAAQVVDYLNDLPPYANDFPPEMACTLTETEKYPEGLPGVTDEVARTARALVQSGKGHEIIESLSSRTDVWLLDLAREAEKYKYPPQRLKLRLIPIQDLMAVPASDALGVCCHHTTYHPKLMQVVQDVQALRSQPRKTIYVTND